MLREANKNTTSTPRDTSGQRARLGSHLPTRTAPADPERGTPVRRTCRVMSLVPPNTYLYLHYS